MPATAGNISRIRPTGTCGSSASRIDSYFRCGLEPPDETLLSQVECPDLLFGDLHARCSPGNPATNPKQICSKAGRYISVQRRRKTVPGQLRPVPQRAGGYL